MESGSIALKKAYTSSKAGGESTMASIQFPELLPKEILVRAKKLNPALLCDGMSGLGITMDGCMDAGIMPVNPDPSIFMIGTAVTVSTSDGNMLPIYIAACTVPRDGYVMVVDGRGCRDRPFFGDLIMGAAKAAGYAGMVCDGYTRDRRGCIEMGFPVFSRGQLQRSATKGDDWEINVPIVCGGVDVKPGDLVIGGADGITVAPRERLEKILALAEKKAAYEEERERVIAAYANAKAAGLELPQLAPQWLLDQLKDDLQI